MTWTPDTLEMRVWVVGCDFTSMLTRVSGLLGSMDDVTLLGWAVPAGDELRSDGLASFFDALATNATTSEHKFARFEFDDDGGGTVTPGDEPSSWKLKVARSIEDLSADVQRGIFDRFKAMLRTLATSELSAHGYVEWDIGAQCGAEVAIAGIRAQVVLTDETAVATDYEDPAAFWAVWDEVEEVGNARLACRAIEARTGADLLERIIDGQWALARAAKPNRTHHYLPDPEDGEEDVYKRGARRMHTVGYDATTEMIELACVLERGEHINGWEIIDLWIALSERQLEQGRPLKEARVVFSDQCAAESEKRVLLDIGARVFYTDDEAVDVELA